MKTIIWLGFVMWLGLAFGPQPNMAPIWIITFALCLITDMYLFVDRLRTTSRIRNSLLCQDRVWQEAKQPITIRTDCPRGRDAILKYAGVK